MKTQKSKTKCSVVEIVVLKLTIVIWDRNGPIINLDASARSASLIFLFRQRFLSLENVYFLILLLLFFQKVGGQPLPLRGPWLSTQTKQEQRKWKALTCFRDC